MYVQKNPKDNILCSTRHPHAKTCWVELQTKESDCSVTSTMLAVINAFSLAVTQINLQNCLSHSVGITRASCKRAPLFLSETSPGVAEVTFVEKEPAERHTIVSWEQVSIFLIKLQWGQSICSAAQEDCQMQWQPCVCLWDSLLPSLMYSAA